MPQSFIGEHTDIRTEAEQQEFRLQLKNVNLLYLGLSVLILTDRSYLSRFWTGFEAFLSMQDASGHGLVASRVGGRCTIHCVHGAPEALIESLVEEWSRCSARQAFDKLSSADVCVTNQSDKDVMLPKLLELNERVAAFATKVGITRGPSPNPNLRGARLGLMRAGGSKWAVPSSESGSRNDLLWRSQTF